MDFKTSTMDQKFWFNLEKINEVGKLPLKLQIYIDTKKSSLVEKGSWKTEKLVRIKVWSWKIYV